MNICATEDAKTDRIEKLTLSASDFRDERTLTILFDALTHGRMIRVEIDDDSEFEFAIDMKAKS